MSDVSFVISAPSGTGKTTLIRKLLAGNPRLGFSVSTTTRARRKNEIDGESYHFVSDDEFSRMMEEDEFVECAEVHGRCYGTTEKEIDRIRRAGKIPIFDVDINGARLLKKNLCDGRYIFIVPPSISELERRLRKRDTDPEEQIRLRLKNAVAEMREYSLYDYIVINDDLAAAERLLVSIIDAELSRTESMEDFMIQMLEDYNENST